MLVSWITQKSGQFGSLDGSNGSYLQTNYLAVIQILDHMVFRI